MKKVPLRRLIVIGLLFLVMINAYWFFLINNYSQKLKKIDTEIAPDGLYAQKTSYRDHNLSFNIYDISESPGSNSINPSIAIDSNNIVHIVWQDDTDGDDDILYRNFSYINKQWGDIVNISDLGDYTGNESVDPDIYIDEYDNIHVVWNENNSEIVTNWDIFYRRKDNTSTIWDNNIYQAAASSLQELNPKVSANSTGDAAIIWQKNTGAKFVINASYFDDSENTMSQGHTVHVESNSLYWQENPDIDCYNDVWHVIFVNYSTSDSTKTNILYKNKTVGNDWEPSISSAKKLSNGSANEADYPRISCGADQVYVCWQDKLGGTNYNVLVQNKSNIGEFSNQIQVIDTSSYTNDLFPTIDLDGDGNVFLSYEYDGSSFVERIKYNKIGPNGYSDLIYKDDSVNRDYPELAINTYGEPFFVWQEGESPTDIYMRKLDTYGPQLDFISVQNDTGYSGIVDLNCTYYNLDISTINYSYYVDNNGDGIANDGNIWQDIPQNPQTEYNYSWDASALNFRYVIIMANATDENGLDEAIMKGNVTIDNTDPTCILIEITDDSGHNSSNGDTRFTGNLNVKFSANDNFLVKNVSLFNGSNFIISNTSNNELYFDSNMYMPDGTYNDLKLITYDIGGNPNITSSVQIYIDNTKPMPQFTNPLNNSEVSGTVPLIVSFGVATDIDRVEFYNYTTDPFANTTIGTDSSPSGGWRINYYTGDFYGPMNISAVAYDEAGLVNSTNISIFIDNIAPTPQLNITGTNVGLTTSVNVTLNNDIVDNDTATVKVFYKLSDTGVFTEFGNKTFAEFDQNHTTYFVYEFTLALNVYLETDENLYIKVEAVDDQGNTGIDQRALILNSQIPNATVLSISNSGYNVTLSWIKKNYNTKKFLIYRSFSPFDTDALDNMLIGDRLNSLGRQKGEKFCIYEVVVNDSNQETYTFVDKVPGPNTYYYLVIVINQYDNPSLTSSASITLAVDDPPRLNPLPITSSWIIIFIIFSIIIVLMNVLSVQVIKRKTRKGLIGLTLDAMVEEEQKALFKKDVFEQELEITEEKLEPVKEEILSQPTVIPEEKEVTISNKCPNCGWILSSKAAKCPRCQFELIEEKPPEEEYPIPSEIEYEEEFKSEIKITEEDIQAEMAKIDEELERARKALAKEVEPKTEELIPPMKPKEEEIIETFEPQFEEVSPELEEKEVTVSNNCPNCGWLLSSKATKCPRCGEEIKREGGQL